MKDYVNKNPEFKQYGQTKIRWYQTNGFMTAVIVTSLLSATMIVW